MPAVPELSPPAPNEGRMMLRRWRVTASDIAAVGEAAGDPDIARYNSVGSAVTPELAETWIRARNEPDRLDWSITAGNSIVGRVSLAHIDNVDGTGELGYWLMPSVRGRGMATDAVGLVEEHAFSTLGLERLAIRHELDNTRSCLLAQRRGYLAEGTQRGAFERRGERRDLHVHARLASDQSMR